eukprot:TRINITY_DN5764_c0_g1_i1.p1 TRINITY_DN5764_c0_g1~~TRINITY_DN5764_c0_g1_i1.p1  ORF type:complete len:320 (+),score=82.62 TRINITY_DN5764_c0_g1_i1:170-1129(+)
MGCGSSTIDVKTGGLGVAKIKPDTTVNCLISWNEQAADVTAQYRAVPVNIESNNTKNKKKGQKVHEESPIRGEWTDLHLEVKNKGERFSKAASLSPGVYELRYFVDGTEHPGAGKDGEIYHKFSVECNVLMRKEDEEVDKDKGKSKKAKTIKDKKEEDKKEGDKVAKGEETQEKSEKVETEAKNSKPEEKPKIDEKTKLNSPEQENSTERKSPKLTSKGSAVLLPTIQKHPQSAHSALYQHLLTKHRYHPSLHKITPLRTQTTKPTTTAVHLKLLLSATYDQRLQTMTKTRKLLVIQSKSPRLSWYPYFLHGHSKKPPS